MDYHGRYFYPFVDLHKEITGLFSFVGGCLFCLWQKGNLFIGLGNNLGHARPGLERNIDWLSASVFRLKSSTSISQRLFYRRIPLKRVVGIGISGETLRRVTSIRVHP
jgi:hypothetical protein